MSGRLDYIIKNITENKEDYVMKKDNISNNNFRKSKK